MPRRLRHHVEHLADELVRDAGMEQVGHGVHEHDPGRRPALRDVEGVLVHLHPRSRGPLVRGSPSTWYFGFPIALRRFASVRA